MHFRWPLIFLSLRKEGSGQADLGNVRVCVCMCAWVRVCVHMCGCVGACVTVPMCVCECMIVCEWLYACVGVRVSEEDRNF